MKLVEQHIIKKKNLRYKGIDAACFASKNLYNAGLYAVKQNFLKDGKWLRHMSLDKKFKEENNPDYRNLSNNSSQQTLRLLDQNLKSYFAAIKAWKRDNKKFLGCPKFPKYLHKTDGRFVLVYTYVQFGFKDGYITFPKKEGLPPLKTRCEKDSIKQVRFIPKTNHYVIEVVYEVADIAPVPSGNIMGVDLGLNNLATCVVKGKPPVIINGKPLKAINQYYNKKFSKLKSNLEKTNGKKTSRKTQGLTIKRNCKVKDYMHKASKLIIDHAVGSGVSTIVAGHNKGWKQEIELGKRNNQNFVQIPFDRFLSMLKYKSARQGLTFIEIEESYTSKCSAVDLEEIKKHDTYIGKRVKRGLFRTRSGSLLNADVNGAWNIIRKESGDAVMPTGTGFGYNPVKKFIN